MTETPAGWNRARVLEVAKHTIPKRVANRDLLRKHFALGIGTDEGTSAGIHEGIIPRSDAFILKRRAEDIKSAT